MITFFRQFFHPMRPITKILLLAVVAFIVYLIWPSSPNIKAFNPGELAGLEVKTWIAEKRDKGLDALLTRFRIYNSQYKFGPFPSFRIAQHQGNGIEAMNRSFPKTEGGAPNATEENRALLAFTQKYVSIRKQAGLDFDPDALAREELAWRALEHDGATPEEVAMPMARILASIFGGMEADYGDVAYGIAYGRSLILRDEVPSDIIDPVQAAQDAASESYSLLKELAEQPTE